MSITTLAASLTFNLGVGAQNSRGAQRTGYKLMRVYTPNGKSTGEYQDFVTGFVANDANVRGRPVGVTVASEGALVFTGDASNSVWRVTYTGRHSGN